MGKFFDLDAPIIRAIGKVGEIMMFTAMWLVCCVPVVTIGASTAALYRMMFNLREDRATKITDFFRAFKENFKQGTALWLLFLAAAAVLLAAYYLVVLVESEMLRLVLLVVFSAVFFIVFITSVWLFPLTAYFENTVAGTLRNAVGMGMGNLKRAIPACALTVLPLVTYLISWELFLRTMYLWLLLAPGAIAYGVVCLLTPVFKRYVDDAENYEENKHGSL